MRCGRRRDGPAAASCVVAPKRSTGIAPSPVIAGASGPAGSARAGGHGGRGGLDRYGGGGTREQAAFRRDRARRGRRAALERQRLAGRGHGRRDAGLADGTGQDRLLEDDGLAQAGSAALDQGVERVVARGWAKAAGRVARGRGAAPEFAAPAPGRAWPVSGPGRGPGSARAGRTGRRRRPTPAARWSAPAGTASPAGP